MSVLNFNQANKLADFFFDLGKGIALGVLGLSIGFSDLPFAIKFFSTLVGVFVVYFCIRIGLSLIKNKND